MSKPIHTPGPLRPDYSPSTGIGSGYGKSQLIAGDIGLAGVCLVKPPNGELYDESRESFSAEAFATLDANARLLTASYNAFDSAAAKLGVNAVELAEAMADGGIVALVEAVQAAKEMSDWFMEHSRQADHAHEELKQPLHETAGWKELIDAGYNGLMASYHGQFEEALAKVKGGAT